MKNCARAGVGIGKSSAAFPSSIRAAGFYFNDGSVGMADQG